MMRALALALLLTCACDQPKLVGSTTTPSGGASPAAGKPMDTHISMATFSLDIAFALGTGGVPGTLTLPKDDGPWPAIVLLAAHGGSGKRLAEALARHGMVVLRFDRAGTGKNPGPPADQLTLDTYRDEGLAAIKYLRSRPEVRPDRVFVACHGEGGIDATRVALADGKVAGVAYLAAPGRPPEPAAAAYDPVSELGKLAVPVLILTGGKDLEVDPELDGRRLEHALHQGSHDVTFYVGVDADHMLEHEPRPLTELRANVAAVQAGYTGEGRALDEPTVKALVDWLAAKSR